MNASPSNTGDESSAPPLAEPPSRLGRAAFLARYGGLYEASPWVAERAYDAGLPAEADRRPVLAAALAAVVEAATEAEQLALLRAHPDLAGRLALAGALTPESRSEQAGAGLDRCTPEEFARFTELNETYKRTFGFPFILAVKGRSRGEILAAFERRIANPPETEFRTALAEVHRIARLRLEAL